MSIYDDLWESGISVESISSEVVAAKVLADELNVSARDIIQMRTALELDRLRETLVNICIFNHRHSHLPNILRVLQRIIER